MNIDLFFNPKGECGLLCNGVFDNMPAGAIFDAETMDLTLEFLESEPFHMNIPISPNLQERMLYASKIGLGMMQGNMLVETLQLPLYVLNQPDSTSIINAPALEHPVRSIESFTNFMRQCDFAQSVHRDDPGEEGTNSSILQGKDPKQLQVSPQLVRQQSLDMGPQGPGGMEAVPTAAPQAPGPKGPGGMGMGGGGGQRRIVRPQRPPTDTDGEN
jgi:hypothetical protein